MVRRVVGVTCALILLVLAGCGNETDTKGTTPTVQPKEKPDVLQAPTTPTAPPPVK